MSKRINRELLLQKLESVQAGLSARDIIEQSSCFIFKDGRVITFNDEIACSTELDIGVEGAVRSAALLDILRKMPEEEIDIGKSEEANIAIHGKGRDVEVTREAKIALPFNSVEKPKSWKDLDEHFLEAIEMVHHCASSDESQFMLTCVHITPNFVEATDNSQITRYKIKTGVETPILVRRDSIKYITTLGMTQFAETEAWIHFRNPKGLQLSCRRFIDDYHDLSSLLDFKGSPITLPKGLVDAADRASVFSSENSDDAQVLVRLRNGRVIVRGESASGKYREVKKVAYTGPDLVFSIAPKLLMDITKKYNDAEITEGRLKVADGKWIYVSCLSVVGED